MPAPFKTLLAYLHRDAVACALADFDAGRDGRESDQRAAVLDLALEQAARHELGDGAHLTTEAKPAVEYWLRCYDAMAATVREPPAPFAPGQRIVVTAGTHKGRLGTVRDAADGTAVDLDPVTGHERPLFKRWTQAADFAQWVTQ